MLGAITMKTLHYKVLLRKRGWNIYDDRTFATKLLNIRTNRRGALAMAKEVIEGFIACMVERGEEVPIENHDSMVCAIAVEANA